ncbi:MAG: hypothetical protein ACSHXL_07360, partial [Bacteroidota bacterium]
MALNKILVLTFLIISLMSCKNDPLKIDSSGIKVSIDYYNMDSVFVNSKGEDLKRWNNIYKSEINEAYEYELGMGLRIGVPEDTVILKNIELFSNDPEMAKFEEKIS